jgi:SET domain-containing protein
MDPLDNYTTYAIKDIKKGEEILCDYGCFKVDAVDKLFNVEPMKKETVTASNVMI